MPNATMQEALRAIRLLRHRLEATEAREREPVALVGLGCRFPAAPSPGGFWELLARGGDAITPLPSDRYAAHDRPRGGFLANVADFDAAFFGISPGEAERMDPQQRLLLEVLWETIEDAAITPAALSGSRTGVYVGAAHTDYFTLARDAGQVDHYLGTGNNPSVMAGRLSYYLGLQGPSMTINTACSSSLVAIHLACQSLRSGECDLAFAGGVNLLLTPENFVAYSKAGMLAADGRCKTFDARADGYVRGEGCGMVALKRLSEAQRDGDRIVAVIRGDAVDQDGRSSSLTAPNGPSQQQVIREALRLAGVEPQAVQYVECHGTGTALGDPIEVQALAAVYAEGRAVGRPLILGAVKTNIGHLESAAGIAGVIKVCLALRHESIPPNLHLETPNPHVDWDAMQVALPQRSYAWPSAGKERLAGVSSFGFSGTNAHLVLAEAPAAGGVGRPSPRGEHILALSAKSEPALRELAGRYAAFLRGAGAALSDVCFTAHTGRANFKQRMVVAAHTPEQMIDRLAAFAERAAAPPSPTERQAQEVAAAYLQGAEVDWDRYYGGTRGTRVALPTYPFQRRPYWIASGPAAAKVAPEAELLGRRTETGSNDLVIFQRDVAADAPAYLADHRIFSQVLFPAAAFLELAVHAATESGLGESGAVALRSLNIVAGLGLTSAPCRLQVEVKRSARVVEVYSPDDLDNALRLHAEASVQPAREEPPPAVPGAVMRSEDLAVFYDKARAAGFDYGPRFRSLRRLERTPTETRFEVAINDDPNGLLLHPALIDGCLQAALDPEAAALPIAFEEVYVRGALGARVVGTCRALERGDIERHAFMLRGEDGRAHARFVLVLKRVGAEAARAQGRGTLYEQRYVTVPATGSPRRDVPVALMSPSAEGLIDAFQRCGARAAAVRAGEPVAKGAICVYDARDAKGDVPALLWACAETCRRLEDVELVILTAGAQAADGERVTHPVSAALWGLGRVFQTERPELGTRLIDASGCEHDVIAQEILRAPAGAAPEVLLRATGRRYEGRLTRVTLAPAGQHLRAGAYVISGGTGALGLQVARRLVELGADKVWLLSRRAPDAQAAAAIAALGPRVEAAAIDVGDAQAVHGFAQTLHRAGESVRGVVHAAGVLADATLGELTQDSCERVVRPKVDGADNLTAAFAGAEWIVHFSSVAGLIGNGGQASYAAANAYLDAVANAAEAGPRRMSVQWGPWRDAGMARQAPSRLAGIGLSPLDTTEALDVFEALLADTTGSRAVAVMQVDWSTAAKSAAFVGKEKFADWIAVGPHREGEAPAGNLAAMPESDRVSQIEMIVVEEVRRILHADSASFALDAPLKDLGFDSLMAVDLRNALARRLAVSLPTTLVFDYPSARAIATFVAPRLTRSEPRQPRPEKAAAPEPRGSREPIAIIGFACRYPGDLSSGSAFWKALAEGRDVIGPLPEARWGEVASLYDPDPDALGKSYCKDGGFLSGLDAFDAGFFAIARNEAQSMDPQHRLLLETSWEALEQANIRPDSLNESTTGVYVGLMYQDFAWAVTGSDRALLDGYVGTGASGAVASGRISYLLGLQGPAMTVDTACSSSLVTLHLAAQALRAGECDLALAGGATVMHSPAIFVEFSRLRGIAKDGRCKSFSDAADGVGWSEGCGVVVLKRLRDAERDGDSVLGVLTGSAVNQDGHSNGLTAPNGPAQERVIATALRRASLSPSDIDYVEGHGTGTPLGDPVEIGALSRVFGAEARDKPLWLGSVKSNLGHTQAAAGVAAVIKVLLALEHEMIPRNVHAEVPTPRTEWTGLALVDRPVPWPAGSRRRRAGISSFGISGTNAHLIIEEAPRSPAPPAAERRPFELIPLSAKSEPALTLQLQRWVDYLGETPHALADIAYTARAHRTHFDARTFVVAASVDDARRKLQALARGEPAPEPETEALELTRLGEAFVARGHEALSAPLLSRATGRRVPVPTYAFLRQSYWPSAKSAERAWAAARAAATPADDAARDAARRVHERWDTSLESRAQAYFVAALRELGLFTDDRVELSVEQAAAKGRVDPRFARSFARVLEMLAERRVLQRSPAGYRGELRVTHPDAGTEPEDQPILGLLGALGRGLPAILRGELDPRQLVFADDHAPALALFYRDSAIQRFCHAIAERVVSALGRATPGRLLRVIEIGAGTGSTARKLLPLLPPDRSEYCFTDIGAGFLSDARRAFTAYPFVSYQRLDLNQALAEQGFSPGRFDLLVATNVLHACADLDAALSRAAELLAPGGVLVALELTEQRLYVELAFGLLIGDVGQTDGRGLWPFLTAAEWSRRLRGLGFEPFTVPDDVDVGEVVVVARRSEAQGGARAFSATPSASAEKSSDRPAGTPAGDDLAAIRFLPAPERRAAIVTRLAAHLSEEVPQLAVGEDVPLGDLGLDSLTFIGLRRTLEVAFGRAPGAAQLPSMTLRQVAEWVDRALDAGERSELAVTTLRGAGRDVWYFIDPGGMAGDAYGPLAERLAIELRVVTLATDTAFPDVTAGARTALAAIRDRFGEAPRALAGWSYGASVAQAMAAELPELAELLLIDPPPPQRLALASAADGWVWEQFLDRLCHQHGLEPRALAAAGTDFEVVGRQLSLDPAALRRTYDAFVGRLQDAGARLAAHDGKAATAARATTSVVLTAYNASLSGTHWRAREATVVETAHGHYTLLSEAAVTQWLERARGRT